VTNTAYNKRKRDWKGTFHHFWSITSELLDKPNKQVMIFGLLRNGTHPLGMRTFQSNFGFLWHLFSKRKRKNCKDKTWFFPYYVCQFIKLISFSNLDNLKLFAKLAWKKVREIKSRLGQGIQ